MQDSEISFDQPLVGLSKRDWLVTLARITRELGAFSALGDQHFSAFIEGEDDEASTLLVTFETIQGIRALSETAQPLGWDLAKAFGWAHLCICSDGDTWFRDEAVWNHIDKLTDDGMFDTYDRVLFYGAGPCGYAAAAFSVAAPGSTVVMVQPQATLDPRVTEWDDRFIEMRRSDFESRYGYGPDMLDAAREAFVLYDPAQTLDAMHAALFTKPHVTKLRLRHMGGAIQSDLIDMQILYRVLAKAGQGHLNTTSFAKLYRARRGYPPYLRRILASIDAQHRDDLALMLTRNVTSRMNAPRFQRRLSQLEAKTGTEKAAE